MTILADFNPKPIGGRIYERIISERGKLTRLYPEVSAKQSSPRKQHDVLGSQYLDSEI